MMRCKHYDPRYRLYFDIRLAFDNVRRDNGACPARADGCHRHHELSRDIHRSFQVAYEDCRGYFGRRHHPWHVRLISLFQLLIPLVKKSRRRSSRSAGFVISGLLSISLEEFYCCRIDRFRRYLVCDGLEFGVKRDHFFTFAAFNIR